ncbi:MAG TPA: hypothetical protein VKH36_02280 [Acidimicrobiia bacterium]|nr:hypothetical protein [Acidimicrobiia bacterium]
MSNTRLHPRHANVVLLRPGLAESCRGALSRAAGHFNDAVGELDRVLARVGDRLDETVRAGHAAIRAGRLAYRQQRQRDRVRGPLGLVAGYTPSNNR